jgi:hypothetical protein
MTRKEEQKKTHAVLSKADRARKRLLKAAVRDGDTLLIQYDNSIAGYDEDDVAHWAGMTVAQTREILGHFSTQRRVEIFPGKIVVKNINDFSRFVSSRRKKTYY